MLIDTHCHLNHDCYSAHIDSELEQCAKSGVSKLIVVGFDMPSSTKAVELADKYGSVYASIGIHPQDSHDVKLKDIDTLHKLAEHPKVVAIGEIGLDFHYLPFDLQVQERVLWDQIVIANKFGLPVIIHCRDAYSELFEILSNHKIEHGSVMHCWASGNDHLKKFLSLDCYIGFGGLVTFKNAVDVQECAMVTPANRILLETDAPYMTPTPFRGKQNSPAYVSLVAEKLASIRSESIENIRTVTTKNAESLFPRLDRKDRRLIENRAWKLP